MAQSTDVRINVAGRVAVVPRNVLSASDSSLREQVVGDEEDVAEVTHLELHDAPRATHADLSKLLGWCLQDSFPWDHFWGDGIVNRLPELIEVAVWLHKYGAGPSYREALQCWDRFWREQRRRGFSAWVVDALRAASVREVAELLATSPQLFGVQIDGASKAMSCLDGPDGIVNTLGNGFYALYLEPCSRRGDPPGQAEAIMRARAASATRELRPMAAASAPHAAAFVAEVQQKFATLFHERSSTKRA